MNAKTAKLLREYAAASLPKPVIQKYPRMAVSFARRLKRWWVEVLNAKERAKFRRLAQRVDPIPEELKRYARAHGIITDWPPAPKAKPKRRSWWRPKSWRHERYGGKR